MLRQASPHLRSPLSDGPVLIVEHVDLGRLGSLGLRTLTLRRRPTCFADALAGRELRQRQAACEASIATRRAAGPQPRADYLPREVFFFGFGLPGSSLPAAAARAFCFLVATNPPIAVAVTLTPNRLLSSTANGAGVPHAREQLRRSRPDREAHGPRGRTSHGASSTR